MIQIKSRQKIFANETSSWNLSVYYGLIIILILLLGVLLTLLNRFIDACQEGRRVQSKWLEMLSILVALGDRNDHILTHDDTLC